MSTELNWNIGFEFVQIYSQVEQEEGIILYSKGEIPLRKKGNSEHYDIIYSETCLGSSIWSQISNSQTTVLNISSKLISGGGTGINKV